MRIIVGRALWTALLAVVLSMGLYGQTGSIQGSIPGAATEAIRLMVVDDYISSREVILMESITDSAGNFEFLISLPETTRLSLGIGYYSFDLFVERDGVYVLGCDSIDLKNELRPYYNLEPLPAFVVSEPPPGLNTLIYSFTAEYNEFVLQHFTGIYQRRKASLIKSFKEEMISKYGAYQHPYLDAFIEYRLAGTELAVAAAKRSELFNDHLNDRPILVHHPEYMQFFNDFFDKYLYPDNRFIAPANLYALVNRQADLGALLDSLGKDTTLRNEVIRELVCLKTLGQLYHSRDFAQGNILTLLHEMEAASKFEYHRKVAGNLLKELTSLQKGYPPPAFRLPDLDGKILRLDDFSGKPVYISFVTTWSSACLQELQRMQELFEDYGGRVTFISIYFDRDPAIVKEFVEDKKYGWVNLYNGTRYRMIHDFKLKTFPLFLLLDSHAKVVEYPAYKPSEVIRGSLDRLLEQD